MGDFNIEDMGDQDFNIKDFFLWRLNKLLEVADFSVIDGEYAQALQSMKAAYSNLYGYLEKNSANDEEKEKIIEEIDGLFGECEELMYDLEEKGKELSASQKRQQERDIRKKQFELLKNLSRCLYEFDILSEEYAVAKPM